MNLTNETATILVIGLVVALFVEGIKHTPLNKDLSADLVRLFTLVLGLLGGLIAMHLTGGGFAEYVGIGFSGAVSSIGIYEMIKGLTDGRVTKKAGE